jgi:hypothetical protein
MGQSITEAVRGWWARVNRRFDSTYGEETRQDRKNDMTPTPGYQRGTGSGRHEAERYEADSDPK